MEPYNNTFYLTTDFRLLKEDDNSHPLIATVTEKGYEHFSNYHSSFFLKDSDGNDLVIGSWKLNEININKQWNESHYIKIIICQDDLPPINVRDLINNLDREKNIYWKNSSVCYEEMIQHAVKFIQYLPKGYRTKSGLKLYFRINFCKEKSSLINFYKDFINLKDELLESEVKALDESFLKKLEIMLSV